MFSITELLLVVTTLGLAIIVYFKWTFGYWKRKNIPQINPTIPFGNADNPFNVKRGIQFKTKDFYNELKSKGRQHGGFYLMTNPVYMPVDPEYIKNIMAKDFQHFVNRGVYYNEKSDPLSAHLFSIDGQKWRHLRAKLTPTFTSGKMKMMFQTLLDCGEQLKEELNKIQSKEQALDIKELVSCFTTDIIGSCAFGLECNSFKNPDAEFRRYGRKIFEHTLGRFFRSFLGLSVPKLCKLIGMRVFAKDVASFFVNAIRNVIEFRENNNINRNDFIQILLDLKSKKLASAAQNGLAALTVEEMAAQSFVFFIAGFETSSTTMTFCLYELAKNQIIQQKVRDEIKLWLKKYEGKLTYEGIMEMKYLGQVIDETLRKYPPVPILHRTCTEKYKIPNTNSILETGTKVMISALGLHYDPEYYPDPLKFDPDRFTEENKAQRHQFTHLPFGEGPRNCIGLRFGLMQTKIGLSVMLQNYIFTVNEKTPHHININTNSSITLATKDVILLDVQKATI